MAFKGRKGSDLICVLDDDKAFGRTLQRRLTEAGYEVAVYFSAQQLLEHLPDDDCDPSCIILDIGPAGLNLQKQLVGRGLTFPIIFLTAYPDFPVIVKAIKAGAEDFLTKPLNFRHLFEVVEQATAHHETSRELKTKPDVFGARLSKLSPRQRQVFELVVRGKHNKQIGRQLASTPRTVKAHREQVMKRMRVQSLAELVSVAVRAGVLG